MKNKNVLKNDEFTKIINEKIKNDLIEKKDFKKIIKNYKKNFEIKFKSEKDKNKNNAYKKYYFNKINSKYIIELKNVEKFYKEDKHFRHTLKNINLQIPKGKIITIIGPSGSGKTTLFNLMSGLIRNEIGEVIVNNNLLTFMSDKQLTEFRKNNISFIFQEYNLINTLKNRDNIILGKDLLNKKETKYFNINKLANLLGIENQLNKYPNQISGGQQQRVSIARALIKNPKILLADEPTGALDTVTKKEILKIIEKINKELDTTILLITHSSEVSKIGDYIIKINNGLIENFIKNKNKKNSSDLVF